MRKPFIFLAVLSMFMAACSGPEGGSTTTLGESTTSAADATTTEAGETTIPAVGTGGDDCLVGEWVLDDEAFFETVFADFGDDPTFAEFTAAGGDFVTTFEADGTISAVRSDWGFSVVTGEGTFNIRVNGDQTGTWETDGSMLMLVLDGGSGFESTTTIEVDGEQIALPTSPIDLPAESLSSMSEFSCNGDTLVVISEGFTSTFNRA